MRQRTIKNEVSFSGVGIHKGTVGNVTLKPAPGNSGVVFVHQGKKLAANIKNSVYQQFCTLLSDGEAQLMTVEHLLSAINASLIDNLIVEIDTAEFPILGGDSLELMQKIKSAGLKKQPFLKKAWRITKKVIVRNGDAYAALEPDIVSSFSFTIDFTSRGIPIQQYYFRLTEAEYLKKIAPARTFGFIADNAALVKQGFCRGANRDNCLMLDKDGKSISNEGLRFSDELVRHKILDAIGDIYLSGYRIIGLYTGYKAGHRLNSKLLKEVINQGAFETIAYTSKLKAAGQATVIPRPYTA